MSVAPILLPTAKELADNAIGEMLRTQWQGIPIVLLDSPPGAGKTVIVELLAGLSLGRFHERCMIATNTNEQAFEIARRLAHRYPGFVFTLLVRQGLQIPEHLISRPNVQVIRKFSAIPPGPCVVIANSEKWSWWNDQADTFDCMIVDEAYQLPDYRFLQIAGLARRIVLVGDPGQINPIVSCELERWRHDPAGPHVPCPEALVRRHPNVLQMRLPVSRRLVQDTVQLVQPVFYPDLPFVGMCGLGERGLATTFSGRTALDKVIDLAVRGASLAHVELPPHFSGEVDDELAETIVDLAQRLLARRAWIWDGANKMSLMPKQIGVTCAHVSQVNAVRERLTSDLTDVFVETSDRFQGLERQIMLAYHPLSGRTDASAFHLDLGRMCVMLSRHSVACFLVSRGGINEMLDSYMPTGDRILGIEEDPEFEGWNAHSQLLKSLRRQDRVRRVGR